MGKIKDCILLDNSLFDDDGIECKNFTVADKDNHYICEWEYIQKVFPNVIDKIKAVIKSGGYYIYDSKHDLQISWD